MKSLRLKVVSFPEIKDEMTVMEVSLKMMERAPTWKKVFENSKNEIQAISDLLIEDSKEKGRFLPGNKNLFRAFELTPLNKVKVVLFGQDPYPTVLPSGLPRAQGISFSVRQDDEIPRSLTNIFTEIRSEYPEWNPPPHGDLTGWAKQGILLLNSCLTCPPGIAGGHSKYMLWMPFILKVLEAIEKVNPKCIYVMWGMEAQKLQKYIGEKSTVLFSGHPSPLSANKFFGNGHFKKINEHLISFGQKPIEW